MRKMLIALCGGALVLGGFSYHAFADDSKDGDKKTVEGELVDTYCYSTGGAKGEGHAACGEKCAKSGIPVGILVDGKMWTILANPRPMAEDVSKTVRITGSENADTNTIAPDKVEVKDGDNWKEVKLKDAHHS